MAAGEKFNPAAGDSAGLRNSVGVRAAGTAEIFRGAVFSVSAGFDFHAGADELKKTDAESAGKIIPFLSIPSLAVCRASAWLRTCTCSISAKRTGTSRANLPDKKNEYAIFFRNADICHRSKKFLLFQ